MIWCFGFFFLKLHDDLDEGAQQWRETLNMLWEMCMYVRNITIVTLSFEEAMSLGQGERSTWLSIAANPVNLLMPTQADLPYRQRNARRFKSPLPGKALGAWSIGCCNVLDTVH